MTTDTTGTLLLPPGASTLAPELDAVFYFLVYLSAFFFAIIVGSIIFFALRYRRKGKAELTSGVDHNLALEILWTGIPTLLIIVLFVWGFQGFLKLNIAPGEAIEIKVTGQKWFWNFDYPNGVNVQKELVVPVNQNIKLLLSSRDVIHSFFVPAFRIKMDCLPNRYTIAWFNANRTGVFDLYCTEYCGTQHSSMLGKVRVVSLEDYEAWLETANAVDESIPPFGRGELLYRSKQCFTCHTTDGSPNQAPSFKGMFGKTERMTDGSTVVVDENYIRESILVPSEKVVAGYQNIMATYQGILKDREIDDIIAFIKSLQ